MALKTRILGSGFGIAKHGVISIYVPPAWERKDGAVIYEKEMMGCIVGLRGRGVRGRRRNQKRWLMRNSYLIDFLTSCTCDDGWSDAVSSGSTVCLSMLDFKRWFSC